MGGKILSRVKKDLRKRIKQARKIVFFLDFDGTLTPIRKKPGLAKLARSTKNILAKLARKKNSDVFIISGRLLKDVKRPVGIENIYYAGNHGIELKGPKLSYINPAAKRFIPHVQNCRKRLMDLKIPGALVENKKYSISFHYRLVKPHRIPFLRKSFNSIMKDLQRKKKIKITEGKKVWEIRPNIKWNKGAIVRWVLAREKAKKTLPICIGDDITDEDAFRALGKNGISILVSNKNKKTHAKYRINSPGDVKKILKWCENELSNQKG